jgi:glutathione-regulated potassium-efflux system ancillary protein KefF
MKNTLIISGHPRLSQSVSNRLILEHLITIPGVTVSDIMTNYPEGIIDVDTEQKKLLDADLVIFQFPFHWYSPPSHMRAWMEKVFSFGFAYGEGGNYLKGKKLLLSVTLGGSRKAYSAEGQHQHPVETFLLPLGLFAQYCGMQYLSPVYSYDMVPGKEDTPGTMAGKVRQHAARVETIINSFMLSAHLAGRED